MFNVEVWMEVKALHSQGHSARKIARQTGHSRNTVRKLLQQKVPALFQKPARSSRLDRFKPYLKQRFEDTGLSAVRLLEEIRPMGYAGSLRTLCRFLQSQRSHQQALAKMTVRFETPPGQQAQVDWAYCGKFENRAGELVPVYAFVMVLSFSRMLFVEFTNSMKLPVLIACHQAAFEYFGGWTRTLLYDNMAQVKLPSGEWHPLFLDFAAHHGFAIRTCRPYRARTKGKVERMVEFIKDNFLKGRTFVDMADLNTERLDWLERINNRVHGTTGQVPATLHRSEGLIALSQAPFYQVAERAVRAVSSDGFVRLCGSRYSVPPEKDGALLVGKQVVIEHNQQRVVIRLGEVVLAEHPSAAKPGSCIVNKEHVEALWKLSLKQTPPPPQKLFEMTFDQEVPVRPLTDYDDACRTTDQAVGDQAALEMRLTAEAHP